MIIKFNGDGSINDVVGSNIFQYSAGANVVEIQIDKPQSSNATISLVRADGEHLSAKPMVPKIGGDVSAWTYVFGTAGSPDLVVDGDLEISFTIENGGVKLNLEKFNGTVQTSYNNGYEPIDPETAEILQAEINRLQLEKVDRVDAENVPPYIDYLKDGYKTPNTLYYNFKSNVRTLDDDVVEKNGAILVLRKDGVQAELFITLTGEMFSRTIIDGVASEFKDTTADDFANFYTKQGADERFVHLTGNETISGTKSFENSPIVPNPTANTHTVNRQSMYNYAYSKDEVNRITQGISFDTKAQFELWLAGTYTRPDGLLPSDMIIGKKVFIIEANQPNYRCISLPATSLSNFEVLAEDIKDLQEITATPYKTITAENGQAFVEELKDEVDLKTQIVELEDLTIQTNEWIDDAGDIYFDYTNENYTDPTKQFFEFVSNNKEQNEQIANEGFSVLELDTITVAGGYGVRIFANKAPSFDIIFKVNLINYTDEIFDAGAIEAEDISYDNIISGLIATDVQGAIDELKSNLDTASGDIADLGLNKADKTYVDAQLNLKADKTELIPKADLTYVDTQLNLKADKTYVDTGLGLKINNSQIVQTTGSSTTDIMSQKAVTDLYNGEVLFDNPSGATSIDFSTWGLAVGDVLEIEYYAYGAGTNLITKTKLTGLHSDTDVFLPTYVGANISLYMHLLINNTTKIITVYSGSYSFPDRTQTTRSDKVYKITRVEKGA